MIVSPSCDLYLVTISLSLVCVVWLWGSPCNGCCRYATSQRPHRASS